MEKRPDEDRIGEIGPLIEWDFDGSDNVLGDLTHGLRLPKTQIVLESTATGRNVFFEKFYQRKPRTW